MVINIDQYDTMTTTKSNMNVKLEAVWLSSGSLIRWTDGRDNYSNNVIVFLLLGIVYIIQDAVVKSEYLKKFKKIEKKMFINFLPNK